MKCSETGALLAWIYYLMGEKLRGICRQVLREFSDLSLPVIVGQYGKGFTVKTLGELLPESLSPEDLGVTVE